MTFLNKTGVALRLVAGTLVMGMTAGCFSTQVELGGSSRFDRLPPCSPPHRTTSCEMEEVTTQHDPDVSYVIRRKSWEVGQAGEKHGLYKDKVLIGCYNHGEMTYMGLLEDATSTASAIRACEPIRAANSIHTTPALTKNQETNPAKVAEQRLEACDSFGFERGTEAHAECAMKLYMNEQNQGTARAVTSSNNQQTAALARQQAIQEATNKEQKRIQELEASLRMMQFGIDLMNGTTSSPAPSQTHSQTYNINGQIIRCTTTGSITTCL